MKKNWSKSFYFILFCLLFSSCTLGIESGILGQKKQIYYWQKGDNLEEVAKKFNDSVLDIRRRNHIYEIDDLFVNFPLIVIPQKKKKKIQPQTPQLEFIFPSKGTITSKYGKRGNRFHYGVDFGADKGKDILSTESGVVKRVGTRTGYGTTIEIIHKKNIISLYAHLEKALVRPKQKVFRGQKIGIMGNTGRSTGVHLHFEIIVNETNIDPLRVLKR